MYKLIFILLFIFSCFSCGKTKIKPFKCPQGSVSVTVINKSDKIISGLTLIKLDEIKDTIESGPLSINAKTTICYMPDGESEYLLIAKFNDGDTLKSECGYIEGWRATLETIFADSISTELVPVY